MAFHWHGEEGEQRDLTYAELLADVQRLANGLKARGVNKGDVVGIYLPMIPEVVVAMLACARIGAPHNVVFGGFAPSAVRERLEVSAAKALITADGARRKGKTAPVKVGRRRRRGRPGHTGDYRRVVRSAGSPAPMRPGRDVWYDELLADRLTGPASRRHAQAMTTAALPLQGQEQPQRRSTPGRAWPGPRVRDRRRGRR